MKIKDKIEKLYKERRKILDKSDKNRVNLEDSIRLRIIEAALQDFEQSGFLRTDEYVEMLESFQCQKQ